VDLNIKNPFDRILPATSARSYNTTDVFLCSRRIRRASAFEPVQLIELLFELLKPLSRLAEFAFCGQALVLREVLCGAGHERIARAD
jgi:hypothetical protein